MWPIVEFLKNLNCRILNYHVIQNYYSYNLNVFGILCSTNLLKLSQKRVSKQDKI